MNNLTQPTASFSRRNFLKSIGTTAVGAEFRAGAAVAAELRKSTQTRSLARATCRSRLKVNGQAAS
jgi:hypothetical protein